MDFGFWVLGAFNKTRLFLLNLFKRRKAKSKTSPGKFRHYKQFLKTDVYNPFAVHIDNFPLSALFNLINSLRETFSSGLVRVMI